MHNFTTRSRGHFKRGKRSFQNKHASKALVPVPLPQALTQEFVDGLFERKDIVWDPQEQRLILYRQVFLFNGGSAHCMDNLVQNLRNGNVPISQKSVVRGWIGASTRAADLLNRHPAWNTLIVGDGKGHLWLDVLYRPDGCPQT